MNKDNKSPSRYGIQGWQNGSDCDPPEENKEWITITDLDGEEMAVIICRNRKYFENKYPDIVANKIKNAEKIVKALNYAYQNGVIN